MAITSELRGLLTQRVGPGKGCPLLPPRDGVPSLGSDWQLSLSTATISIASHAARTQKTVEAGARPHVFAGALAREVRGRRGRLSPGRTVSLCAGSGLRLRLPPSGLHARMPRCRLL